MAANAKGLIGALAAAGVALIVAASSARAAPRRRTRAETDAAFRTVMYRFFPKATVDTIQAQWVEGQRMGMTESQSRELLIRLVVKYAPWRDIVAFNRAILPMLETGAATIPGATAAFQSRVIEGVKAHGLNPELPPEYAAVTQGAACVAAGYLP